MLRLKTLVLEDHLFQRSLAVSALQQCGVATVLEAADGEEALAVLRAAGGVDVVICDLRIPGMEAMEFLREAHLSGLIHSVIISSEVDTSIRQGVISLIDCFGLNFLGDLGKPFKKNSLHKLLKRHEQSQHQRYSMISWEMTTPNVSELRAGLRAGEFKAYFQPKVDLWTGRMSGAEVLVRWLHPERGILAPSHFLPFMELHGLMDELLLSLFAQGCELQSDLRRCNNKIELAYNLSVEQLATTGLFERVNAIRIAYDIPPGNCMFEVTETDQLTAPATSLENMIRLRLLGYSISMDDYGVGYSSLSRICELPFNQIKLDKKILQDLHRKPMNESIIKSTINLATLLGFSLVIEGVETEEQAQAIRKLGCRFAQGFYFARPMTSGSMRRYIDHDFIETHKPKRKEYYGLEQR